MGNATIATCEFVAAVQAVAIAAVWGIAGAHVATESEPAIFKFSLIRAMRGPPAELWSRKLWYLFHRFDDDRICITKVSAHGIDELIPGARLDIMRQ